MATSPVEIMFIEQDIPDDLQWPEVAPLTGHIAFGTVYLAGPISGMTYDEARYGWRKYVSERLLYGIGVLSPMRHEGYLSEVKTPLTSSNPEELARTNPFARDKAIYHKDYADVKKADLVFVNLLGAQRVSIGTCVEIGIAAALNKTIIVVMEPGNIHDHPFVKEPAMMVVTSLDEGIAAVNALLSEGV